MSSFSVTGTIVEIYPTQVVSDRFKKREFAIEITDGGQYPQYPKFQCTQAKCDILDNYKIGDSVTIRFNLRGTRYEKNGTVNYFSNLEAWAIELSDNAGKSTVSVNDTVSNIGPIDSMPPFVPDSTPGEDLPF